MAAIPIECKKCGDLWWYPGSHTCVEQPEPQSPNCPKFGFCQSKASEGTHTCGDYGCGGPCDEKQPGSYDGRMAKTTAQRQADFKQAMRDAGFVRLEAYVTKEQREKFRQLGGDDWLRKKIEAARVKDEKA